MEKKNVSYKKLPQSLKLLFTTAGSLSLLFLSVNAQESSSVSLPDVLVIDTMESQSVNSLGGRNAVYKESPSDITFSKSNKFGRIENNPALKIKFNRQVEGGRGNRGGWCGFYTKLKDQRKYTDNFGYLNGSKYNYMSFWVKIQQADFDFRIGVADKAMELADDSALMFNGVGSFVPAGKLTTEWQQAVIPLTEFPVDWTVISAVSIAVEGESFIDVPVRGEIFIDDIKFHVNDPS